MKFTFKIQQYQTDAVDAVVRVFQGQPYTASTSYMRDIGTLSNVSGQMRFLPGLEDDTQLEIEDLMSEIGYKNEALQLTDDQLHNLRHRMFIHFLHAEKPFDSNMMEAIPIGYLQHDTGIQFLEALTDSACCRDFTFLFLRVVHQHGLIHEFRR